MDLDVLDIVEKALLVDEPAERLKLISESCGNNQEQIDSIVFLIDVVSEEIEQPELTADDVKEAYEVPSDELSAFDILAIVTEDGITTQDQEKLVIELCAGDESKVKEVNRRLEMLSDDIDEAINENIIQESYKSLKNGGINDPKALEGLIVNDYRLDSFIDKGSYGFVYKGTRIDGKMKKQQVAIKVINPSIKNILPFDLIDREADIMAMLNHKYIVNVLHVGSVNYNGMFLDCHITEFVNGCNIFEAFPLSLDNLIAKIKCVARVAKALEHSHKNKLIHADIKPENILVRYSEKTEKEKEMFLRIMCETDVGNTGLVSHDLEPVLLDFSISPTSNAQGTSKADAIKFANNYRSPYSSPEYLQGESLSARSDVYSLGVLLHALIINKEPCERGQFEEWPSDILLGKKEWDYNWCLGDLDAIIKKACAKNPDDRYNNVTEFKNDLYKFIEFKPVSAKSESLPAKVYKKTRRNPLMMTGLAMGFVSFLYAAFYSIDAIEQNAQYRHNLALSEEYSTMLSEVLKPVVSRKALSKDFFEDSLSSWNKFDNATTEKRVYFLSSLAEMATNAQHFDIASEMYEKLLKSFEDELNEKDRIKHTSKYIVALNKSGQSEKSQRIAAPMFDSMVGHNYDDPVIVGAFLEMFDSASRYIYESYEESVPLLEILRQIEQKPQLFLAPEHRSLLHYHTAKERYYSFFGDYASTSIGQSEDFYQEEMVPVYKDTRVDIDKALYLLKGTRQEEEYRHQYLSLSARIEYELRNTKAAKKLSNRAIRYAKENWGDSPITQRAYVIDFTVNRHVDLNKMLSSARNADRMQSRRGVSRDDLITSSYYLADALLMSGKLDKDKALILSLINKYTPEQLDYEGLDSMEAMIIDYLGTTEFDKSDADNKILASYALAAAERMKTIEPNEFEQEKYNFARLINLYFNDELKGSDIFNYFNKTKKFPSNLQATKYTYLAILSIDLKEHEVANNLVSFARQAMVYTEFERTNSVNLMSMFASITKVYIAIGDIDAARNTFNNAATIYRTHEDALSGSYFAKQLTELNDKLIFS